MKKYSVSFLLLMLVTSLSCRRTETAAPAELINAIIYLDQFQGTAKMALTADVISVGHETLKFKFNGSDFDYSGHFSIFLTTPRKHKGPALGLGSPETAKLLTLDDFYKDQKNSTMLLENVTIWEKSDGFIVATTADNEVIHSGNYTIQN